MHLLFKEIKERTGVNKAIAFNTVARAVHGVGGFVTVFLVAKYLSLEEQGYYYTFGSILSIQIFIELGLGGIITQFVAHEFAFLHIDEKNQITGENNHLSRLSTLIRFFIKWYICAAIALFVLLFIVGFFFFSNYSESNTVVEWKIPWLILILATSFNLLLSPLFAFFEGIQRIKEVAFIRMITQICSLFCIWAILICGGKLYTASFTSLMNFAISLLLLFHYKGLIKYLKSVSMVKPEKSVGYFKDIFPYQWRIALSWMSGYFIFQLFNPILFAFCGPETAGRMGMTLTVLNGILNLTLTWTTTNIPIWSAMIALKNYSELDLSFYKVLKASSTVCLIGILLFLLILYILKYEQISIFHRFLPLYLTGVLSITIFANNIINAWATYLRCHKKEPFLVQAILVGLCSAFSTFTMAKLIGIEGVVLGYTAIVIFISLPLSFYIFKTKKVEYNV